MVSANYVDPSKMKVLERVPLGENDRPPRTLDSSKSYKQLILYDLKITKQIAYLQRKKLILLSKNKIAKSRVLLKAGPRPSGPKACF